MKKPTTIRVPMELKTAKAVFNFHVEKDLYGKLLETELVRRQAQISREKGAVHDLEKQEEHFVRNLKSILGHRRLARIAKISQSCGEPLINWIIYL